MCNKIHLIVSITKQLLLGDKTTQIFIAFIEEINLGKGCNEKQQENCVIYYIT